MGLVTSIYTKFKQRVMNWSSILIALFNAIIAIVAVYTNEQKRKVMHIFSWRPTLGTLLYILIVALFIASVGNVIYQDTEQNKRDMASAYQGVLQPESVIFVPGIYYKYPYIEIGDSGVAFNWSGPSGQPFLKIFEDTALTMLEDNGQIKISANIRGEDGSVAVLDMNEWMTAKQPQIFDRNYNKNTLEVKDNKGDIVLQVRVLSDRIQFQGKFYDEYGNGVALVGRKAWGAGVIEFTGVDYPELGSSIEPIFKNNSGLHFGEIQRLPGVTSQLAFYNLSGPVVIPSFNVDGKSTGGGGEVIAINKYAWNKTEGHIISSPWKGWLNPPLVIEHILV